MSEQPTESAQPAEAAAPATPAPAAPATPVPAEGQKPADLGTQIELVMQEPYGATGPDIG